MKPMKRVYVLVELEIEKDIKDLTDKVAQRCYTLDGVWDTTAKLLCDSESFTLASAWIEAEKASNRASEAFSEEKQPRVASGV